MVAEDEREAGSSAGADTEGQGGPSAPSEEGAGVLGRAEASGDVLQAALAQAQA